MRYKNLIDRVREKYHLYLTSTPRYERFMDGETLQDWVFLLGPDVLLLTHADVTATIAQKFIAHNAAKGKPFSQKAGEQLLLAAWIHDWGEIIIEGEGIGDITFEKKTDADQAIETTIVNKILEDFHPETTRRMFHKVYQEVVLKRNKELGEAFNVIERLGYLETSLNAYKGKNGKYIRNWKGLTGNVFSNQIIKLIDYSISYPYVKHVLQTEEPAITSAFLVISDANVPSDNEKNPSYDKGKIQQAYEYWQMHHKKLVT